MKEQAGDLEERTVFDAVLDILVREMGVPARKVVRDARITEDLGIYGDDGRDLLHHVGARFEMDWGDMWPEIHFGAEGWGSGSAGYAPQPVSVGDLVGALRSGRWPGTKLVPRSSVPTSSVPKERFSWRGLFSWYDAGVIATGLAIVAMLVTMGRW